VSPSFSCKTTRLIVCFSSRLTDARREAASALAQSLGEDPDSRVERSFPHSSADGVWLSFEMERESEGFVKALVFTYSFGERDDDVAEAGGRTSEWIQQQVARICQDAIFSVVVRCTLEVSSEAPPKDAPQGRPLVLDGQTFALCGADYAPVAPGDEGVTRLKWSRNPGESAYKVEVHYTHERVGPSLAADLWASETAYAAQYVEQLFS
jgi:hypothetical protein